MLMPWRIDSDRERDRAAAAFPEFAGRMLVPAGLSDRDAETLRGHVVERMRAEADPANDLWIAAGRLEHPKSLFSLLHARVDPAEGASVDLLMALPQRDPYGGYGEFALLTLLLERMNVRRLRIPVSVDAARAGLTSAGWTPAPDGAYVR